MRTWLAFISGLVCWSTTALALTMQVSAHKIAENQAVKITIASDSASPVPDLSPLQKDFVVMGTERSVQYSMTQGHSSSHYVITIMLSPRRLGYLMIPALTIGTEKTTPERIEVVAENIHTQQAQSARSLSIQASLSHQRPYVHQQILYTITMHYPARLLDARLTLPPMRSHMMVPLEDPAQDPVNAEGMTTVTRHYLLYPQKAGTVEIPAPTLSGIILKDVPERIQMRGNALTMHVQASPATSYWLPARRVTIQAQWDAPLKSLQAGDTISRAITLEAAGLPAELLPTLVFRTGNGVRTYPERPRRRNTLAQKNILGSTITKVTYQVQKSGEHKIPAVTVRWFNTKTAQFENATLPEVPIRVTGNTEPVQMHPGLTQHGSQAAATRRWDVGMLLAIIFGVGWMSTILGYLCFRYGKSSRREMLCMRLRLKKACRHHDAVLVKSLLLAWAQRRWPDSSNISLMEVQRRVQTPLLRDELEKLSQALYAPSAQPWSGKDFWRVLSASPEYKKTG